MRFGHRVTAYSRRQPFLGKYETTTTTTTTVNSNKNDTLPTETEMDRKNMDRQTRRHVSSNASKNHTRNLDEENGLGQTGTPPSTTTTTTTTGASTTTTSSFNHFTSRRAPLSFNKDSSSLPQSPSQTHSEQSTPSFSSSTNSAANHQPHHYQNNNNNIINNNINLEMPPSRKEEMEFLVVPLRASSEPFGPYHSGAATTTTTEDLEKAEPKSSSWSHKSANLFQWAASFKAVSSSLLYSFCSVSMILTNKSLASSYNHLLDGSLNLLLVVFQALAAVILVEACRYAKWVNYPPLTWDTVRAWAPVNVFFCLMLFTGMASLQTNSVPMVTIFKNVANICTATGDYFFYGSPSEPLAVAAFAIMLGGAVFAASNDVSVTWTGLFWMLANCLSTSGYVLYMKHATQTIQMSKFGMVFCNNVLAIVFLLPLATLTGEVGIFLKSTSVHTWDYFFKNAFAGFVGFFLNFASLNCVAAAGPTTYAIVGSLNKVPVALLGFLFFRTPMNRETAFFIAVSLGGGFLYSYAKILSAQQPRPASA